MNKSLMTNLFSAIFFGIFFISPEFFGKKALSHASLFALSGAFTNWLAVYMLFERIPGMYGSGIISLRFEQFKEGIHSLIMENFFTEENFSKVTREALPHEIKPELVLSGIDFDKIFLGFVSVVKSSSFGGMLDMFGGDKILEPLREPFKNEFEKQVVGFVSDIDIGSVLQKETDFETFRSKIDVMVNERLNELSPKQVKEIIEEMIRNHLGWLVVWGGVFGAIIGFISTILL
ncbi:MAG: DUF445 domain-containing protein [Candidatus Brocadiaceae bacterium]|nr:DUF445 domain-containing protein [Candidatus Brocadiaceae bacterium]